MPPGRAGGFFESNSMSFTDDARGKDFRADPYFIRPATQIVITTVDGEHITTIELPELRLSRDECSPEWVALHEAELLQGATMPNDDNPETPQSDAESQVNMTDPNQREVTPWA